MPQRLDLSHADVNGAKALWPWASPWSAAAGAASLRLHTTFRSFSPLKPDRDRAGPRPAQAAPGRRTPRSGLMRSTPDYANRLTPLPLLLKMAST